MAKTRGTPSPEEKRRTAARSRPATRSKSLPAHNTNRRSPRVGVRKRVDVSSRDQAIIGFTRDISTGGIFLTTGALLPVGTELCLRLALSPDVEPTEMCGVVVRSGTRGDERGMAVAFRVANNQPEKRLISAFIHDEKLQVELKRAESSRHELSRGRSDLEAERLEVQHERLHLADAEAETARHVGRAKDEARALRREVQAERAANREQLSRDRTKLGKQRAQVRRDRHDIEKQRQVLAADRTKLEKERAESEAEMTALREELQKEREAHAQDVVRERQFAKHLAARKTAEGEKALHRQLAGIEEERQRLGHMEGLLEVRRKQIDDRAAAHHGQEAELEAVLEQRCSEFKTELLARERQLEAKIAAATVREEDLQRRLRNRDLDANQSGRDSDRRINELQRTSADLEARLAAANAEIERLNDETTRFTMLGDISEAKAQDTKQDRAVLSAELERLERSTSGLQEQLSEALVHLSDAEQKLAMKSEIISELEIEWQARIDESEAECARLREQLGGSLTVPVADVPVADVPVLAPENTVLTPPIAAAPVPAHAPIRTLANPFTGGVTVLCAPPRAAPPTTLRQSRSSRTRRHITAIEQEMTLGLTGEAAGTAASAWDDEISPTLDGSDFDA
ncbi:MAG: PilZ domain-containing protein [Myxococcota bacterium]